MPEACRLLPECCHEWTVRFGPLRPVYPRISMNRDEQGPRILRSRAVECVSKPRDAPSRSVLDLCITRGGPSLERSRSVPASNDVNGCEMNIVPRPTDILPVDRPRFRGSLGLDAHWTAAERHPRIRIEKRPQNAEPFQWVEPTRRVTVAICPLVVTRRQDERILEAIQDRQPIP